MPRAGQAPLFPCYSIMNEQVDDLIRVVVGEIRRAAVEYDITTIARQYRRIPRPAVTLRLTVRPRDQLKISAFPVSYINIVIEWAVGILATDEIIGARKYHLLSREVSCDKLCPAQPWSPQIVFPNQHGSAFDNVTKKHITYPIIMIFPWQDRIERPVRYEKYFFTIIGRNSPTTVEPIIVLETIDTDSLDLSCPPVQKENIGPLIVVSQDHVIRQAPERQMSCCS